MFLKSIKTIGIWYWNWKHCHSDAAHSDGCLAQLGNVPVRPHHRGLLRGCHLPRYSCGLGPLVSAFGTIPNGIDSICRQLCGNGGGDAMLRISGYQIRLGERILRIRHHRRDLVHHLARLRQSWTRAGSLLFEGGVRLHPEDHRVCGL